MVESYGEFAVVFVVKLAEFHPSHILKKSRKVFYFQMLLRDLLGSWLNLHTLLMVREQCPELTTHTSSRNYHLRLAHHPKVQYSVRQGENRVLLLQGRGLVLCSFLGELEGMVIMHKMGHFIPVHQKSHPHGFSLKRLERA